MGDEMLKAKWPHIRVLIADDQPRSRRSLKALLTAMGWSAPNHLAQPGRADSVQIEIIGEAEDGQQAVAQVRALQPDVVVMDLQLHPPSHAEPEPGGLAAIRIIKSEWPIIWIVVLTLFATDRASALAAGADAFLLKGCPTGELLATVMAGPR